MEPGKDLIIPCIRNGPLLIGDFFDCKTGTRLGVNLFGKNLKQTLAAIKEAPDIKQLLKIVNSTEPQISHLVHKKDAKDSANNLSISAEITAEMLGGILKISGGLDFELGWRDGSSSEEIERTVIKPNVNVSLKTMEPADMAKFVDPDVMEQYFNGGYKSLTHIVTAMDVGGTLLGNIKITQKNKGNNYKIGFWLEGTIDLVVISAKLGANASVGEDILEENYEKQIKLSSMPPIDAPTEMTDFNNDNDKPNISHQFAKALKDQLNFPTWDRLLDGNGKHKIEGIPIKFYLQPYEDVIDNIPIIEPDPDPEIPDPENPDPENPDPENPDPENPDPENPEPENPETIKADLVHPIAKSNFEVRSSEKKSKSMKNEEVMNLYNICMSDLYRWRGEDFLRKELLKKQRRGLKILSEPNHPLNLKTIEYQESLTYNSNVLIMYGSEAFASYKKDYILSEFEDNVKNLNIRYASSERIFNEWIEDLAEKLRLEISALNLDEPDPNDDEEDMMPLIYFTNESGILAWKGSGYTRILYRSFKREEDEEPFQHAQRLYNLSRHLGAHNIQPGIAYPSLLNSKNQNELFSIQTPYSEVLYKVEEEGKVTLIIDILEDSLANKSKKTNNLYNCFFETVGAQVNFEDQQDLALLLGQLEGFISDSVFCRETTQLITAVQATSELRTSVFSYDGASNIHSVISSMKANVGNNIIWGTFGITSGITDTPLFFIAKEGKIQGVCLDHLDTLIMHDEANEEEVPEILAIRGTFEVSPLTLKGVVDYARAVRDLNWGTQDGSIVRLEDNQLITSSAASDICTSIVLSKLGSPKQFIDTATYYTTKSHETLFVDRPLHNWDPELKQFSHEVSDSDSWNIVSVDIMNVMDAHFVYKVAVNEFLNNMESVALPPEKEDGENEYIPMELLPDPEKPPPPPTREDLDKMATQFLFDNRSFASQSLRNRIAIIQKVGNVQLRGYAKLYVGAAYEELYGATVAKEHRDLSVLLGIIEEVAADSNVSWKTMQSYLKTFLKPLDKNLWEIDFNENRMYKLVNDLRENNPELYYHPYEEFVTLQTSLKKLFSVDDWYELRALVAKLDQEAFREEAQIEMWKNPKFLFLIRRNIERAYILEEMRTVYGNTHSTIPSYIPRDIKTLLIGTGTTNPIEDGWDEIVIPPIWNNTNQALKIFKRIAVTQKIPKVFMRIMLNNVIAERVDGIKIWLQNAGALFYWNENNEIFKEPWDLGTIEDAIGAIMKKNSEEDFSVKFKSIGQSDDISNLSTKLFKTPQSLNKINDLQNIQSLDQISEIFDKYPKDTHVDILKIINAKRGTLPLIVPSKKTLDDYYQLPLLNEKHSIVVTFINCSEFLNELFKNTLNFFKSSSSFGEYSNVSWKGQTICILNISQDFIEDDIMLKYIKSISSFYIINCGSELEDLLHFKLKPDPRIHKIRKENEDFFINGHQIKDIFDVINYTFNNNVQAKLIGQYRSFYPPNNLGNLVSLFSKTTAENLKRNLIFHMAHKPVKKSEFESYWEKHPFYQIIISEIIRLLTTQEDNMELQILKEILADLTNESEATSKEAFNSLLSQDDAKWMNQYPIKEKRNVLGSFHNEIQLNQITVSDLILETCRASNYLENSSQLNQILEGIRKHLLLGNEIEIPITTEKVNNPYFQEEWSLQLLQKFENDGKFLFVTLIGCKNESIWEVMEKITGIQCQRVIISDFLFKILTFDEGLREQTQISGIVLILSAPVVDKRFYSQQQFRNEDKKRCAFLLTNCHLTIVADYDKSNQELSNFLKTSIFDAARIKENSQIPVRPNLVFHGAVETELQSFLEQSKLQMEKLRTFGEVGAKGDEILESTLTMLGRGLACFKDREEIVNILVNLASENKYRCQTIPDYFKQFKHNWAELVGFIPFGYKSFEDYEAEHDFKKLLDPVHLAIDDAYFYHFEGIKNLIYQGLLDIMKESNNELDTFYFEKKKVLISEISSHFILILADCREEVTEVKIYSLLSRWKTGKSRNRANCLKSDEEVEGGPCKYCISQTTLEDEVLGKLTPELRGTAFLAIRKHEETERNHFNSLISQMVEAQEIFILNKNPGDEDFLKSRGLTEIQEVSLKYQIPNSTRRFNLEEVTLLPYAHTTWKNYPKNYNSFDELGVGEKAYPKNVQNDFYFADEFLNWEQLAWLKHYQRIIVERVLRNKEIHQNGIVRETVAETDLMFTKFHARFEKQLVPSFKSQVLQFALISARNKLNVSELEWNKSFEPITVWNKFNV